MQPTGHCVMVVKMMIYRNSNLNLEHFVNWIKNDIRSDKFSATVNRKMKKFTDKWGVLVNLITNNRDLAEGRAEQGEKE